MKKVLFFMVLVSTSMMYGLNVADIKKKINEKIVAANKTNFTPSAFIAWEMDAYKQLKDLYAKSSPSAANISGPLKTATKKQLAQLTTGVPKLNVSSAELRTFLKGLNDGVRLIRDISSLSSSDVTAAQQQLIAVVNAAIAAGGGQKERQVSEVLDEKLQIANREKEEAAAAKKELEAYDNWYAKTKEKRYLENIDNIDKKLDELHEQKNILEQEDKTKITLKDPAVERAIVQRSQDVDEVDLKIEELKKEVDAVEESKALFEAQEKIEKKADFDDIQKIQKERDEKEKALQDLVDALKNVDTVTQAKKNIENYMQGIVDTLLRDVNNLGYVFVSRTIGNKDTIVVDQTEVINFFDQLSLVRFVMNKIETDQDFKDANDIKSWFLLLCEDIYGQLAVIPYVFAQRVLEQFKNIIATHLVINIKPDNISLAELIQRADSARINKYAELLDQLFGMLIRSLSDSGLEDIPSPQLYMSELTSSIDKKQRKQKIDQAKKSLQAEAKSFVDYYMKNMINGVEKAYNKESDVSKKIALRSLGNVIIMNYYNTMLIPKFNKLIFDKNIPLKKPLGILAQVRLYRILMDEINKPADNAVVHAKSMVDIFKKAVPLVQAKVDKLNIVPDLTTSLKENVKNSVASLLYLSEVEPLIKAGTIVFEAMKKIKGDNSKLALDGTTFVVKAYSIQPQMIKKCIETTQKFIDEKVIKSLFTKNDVNIDLLEENIPAFISSVNFLNGVLLTDLGVTKTGVEHMAQANKDVVASMKQSIKDYVQFFNDNFFNLLKQEQNVKKYSIEQKKLINSCIQFMNNFIIITNDAFPDLNTKMIEFIDVSAN